MHADGSPAFCRLSGQATVRPGADCMRKAYVSISSVQKHGYPYSKSIIRRISLQETNIKIKQTAVLRPESDDSFTLGRGCHIPDSAHERHQTPSATLMSREDI